MDQQARTISAPAHAVPVPRVGVGVLLLDRHQRVLLTLRILPPEAGCWSIVGGKLDYLESLEQCAIREAREEVGVDIAIQSHPNSPVRAHSTAHNSNLFIRLLHDSLDNPGVGGRISPTSSTSFPAPALML